MNYLKFIFTAFYLTAAFPFLAQDVPPVTDPAATALTRLRAGREDLGLSILHDFAVKDQIRDGLGLTHIRLQQLYRGIPVWGGQAILHCPSTGGDEPMTDALVRDIQVETHPNVSAGEALAVAQAGISPGSDSGGPPTAELVIWPETARPATGGGGGARDATDPRFDPAILGHRLAYHLHVGGQDPADGVRNEDFLVDAHTGALIRSWSTLFTARRKRQAPRPTPTGTPAKGVGKSLFSGEVALGTLKSAQSFELTDPTRGGLTTLNLGGAFAGHGAAFVNSANTWGDGLNYESSRGPDSPNGQTAAVDAHFGLQAAWDFYRNILGREGVDGLGRAVTNRVHFGERYQNAFWDDACFCLTFGDGIGESSLVSVDVVGHELSHGLCSATANLIYEGESGALNEANSDIFGLLIRFYAQKAGGSGPRIPEDAGPWTMGKDARGQPFRHFDQPSLDGQSPDEWFPELGALDVHLGSGPMNRAFYFLAQGASPDPAAPAHSPRLPEGMQGIGNDKALRIWWRTLSTRLTPTSGYRQARRGSLQCARELYGKGSAEERAVAKAFQAINVGKGPQ